MKLLNKHIIILVVMLIAIIVFIISTIGICGFIYYNNYYAQRVIEAIEQEDIPKLEQLMRSPFGNLNCKPRLWIMDVMGETLSLTPLQVACKAGDPEIVGLLLENGADVNYTYWDATRAGSSPLMCAVGSMSDERLAVVKLLVQHGADVHYESIYGNDALSCAVYASFDRADAIDVIEFLEQSGMNIHKNYGSSKDTLLHKACEKDSFLVIQYLVKQRGLDVNAVNENGDTPMICFVRHASSRSEDTVRFFIQEGAKLNAKNNEGKTAYDYAVERHPEFAELLDV